MPDRVRLTEISSRAWEHPADRAALNTLRALPGFDEVVRKVAGFLGERGVRQLFLANAVRIGGAQRPALAELYGEVLETLDAPTRWDLYVSQTPIANAFAVGFDRPFIVLNSGMLALLDREGRRNVIAHEVGHIMSGHATYTTLALLILMIGLRNLPMLTGLALLPFELAILEWYRKAEFSADRAGLLGSQDVRDSMKVFLELAGGSGGDDTIDLDTFMAQAAEYEGEPGVVDKIWQILNTMFKTHPFATVRAAELQRWVASGEYDRILRGEYPRRGQEPPPLSNDYAQAGDYYAAQAREVVSSIRTSFDRARQAFSQGYRGPGNGGATGTGGSGTA
jgi:Zn-dependent protease with chaperone function